MPTSLLFNALNVVTMRLVIPWNGPWVADLDIDFGDAAPVVPPGPCILTVGTQLLRGAVDSKSNGVFGWKGGARVVAGLNGWQSTTEPFHFHNDAGVLSSVVIPATAATVGETAIVALPSLYGTDYIREAGPASQVLEGLDWYVDLTGITQVSPRIPFPALPTSYDVIDFDPLTQLLTLGSDTIVLPGTIITDTRFGAVTLRDVEQTWDEHGARAVCFCGTPGIGQDTRLAGAVSKFLNRKIGKAGSTYLTSHAYRIVTEGADGRLILQPVDILGPLPPTLPLSVVGAAGVTATYVPGTICYVAFVNGDPGQPQVVAIQDPGGLGKPLQLKLDALLPSGVVVGGVAPQPVAKMTALATWATEVEAALSALGHAVPTPFASLPIASTKLVTD